MKVLIPTDGSAHALKAVEEAAKMISKETEEVTADVMYVNVEGSMYVREIDEIVGNEPMEKAFAEAKEAFEKYTDVVPGTLTEEGPSAAQIIVKTLKEGKYDVVYIGAEGMTGSSLFTLGSVANKVVHHAPCSVMVVR